MLLTVSSFSTFTSQPINVCIFANDINNKLFIIWQGRYWNSRTQHLGGSQLVNNVLKCEGCSPIWLSENRAGKMHERYLEDTWHEKGARIFGALPASIWRMHFSCRFVSGRNQRPPAVYNKASFSAVVMHMYTACPYCAKE